jgi:DNA-binding beta-propeller fold protein YncE
MGAIMMVGKAACLTIAVAALAASSAFAESLRREAHRETSSAVIAGDAADENHYILECHGICRGGRKATEVPIGSPAAVTTDPFGNLYFSSENIAYMVDATGALFRVAGNGTPGYSGDGGPAGDAALNIPFDDYPEIQADFLEYGPLVGGLAADASGNLYIADAYNNRVRKIDSQGIITTVAGGGKGIPPGDTGPATSASLGWPQGVAVDPSGNLFIADGVLRKVTTDGLITGLTDNNCGNTFMGPGLCAPEGVAVAPTGDVYVADGYCRVRLVKANGSSLTVAGDDTHPDGHGMAFTCGYSGDGGPATMAAMAWPYSVAVDTTGNLYIADTFNDCIRKVDAGGFITRFAGVCGSGGYSGDGGPAVEARLRRPYGVAVDKSGNVFIADTENHRIRMITVGGIITTVAGNGEL